MKGKLRCKSRDIDRIWYDANQIHGTKTLSATPIESQALTREHPSSVHFHSMIARRTCTRRPRRSTKRRCFSNWKSANSKDCRNSLTPIVLRWLAWYSGVDRIDISSVSATARKATRKLRVFPERKSIESGQPMAHCMRMWKYSTKWWLQLRESCVVQLNTWILQRFLLRIDFLVGGIPLKRAANSQWNRNAIRRQHRLTNPCYYSSISSFAIDADWRLLHSRRTCSQKRNSIVRGLSDLTRCVACAARIQRTARRGSIREKISTSR